MSSTITAQTPNPTLARVYTPFDVLEMVDGVHYELVDGQLVELNMSFLSQRLGFRVGHLLENHCERDGLAYVVTEAGYTCFPNQPNRMRRAGREPCACRSNIARVDRAWLPADSPRPGH